MSKAPTSVAAKSAAKSVFLLLYGIASVRTSSCSSAKPVSSERHVGPSYTTSLSPPPPPPAAAAAAAPAPPPPPACMRFSIPPTRASCTRKPERRSSTAVSMATAARYKSGRAIQPSPAATHSEHSCRMPRSSAWRTCARQSAAAIPAAQPQNGGADASVVHAHSRASSAAPKSVAALRSSGGNCRAALGTSTRALSASPAASAWKSRLSAGAREASSAAPCSPNCAAKKAVRGGEEQQRQAVVEM